MLVTTNKDIALLLTWQITIHTNGRMGKTRAHPAYWQKPDGAQIKDASLATTLPSEHELLQQYKTSRRICTKLTSESVQLFTRDNSEQNTSRHTNAATLMFENKEATTVFGVNQRVIPSPPSAQSCRSHHRRDR